MAAAAVVAAAAGAAVVVEIAPLTSYREAVVGLQRVT
jgi:hypothetical protein